MPRLFRSGNIEIPYLQAQESLYHDWNAKTDANIRKALDISYKYDKVLACKEFVGIPVRDITSTGRTVDALTYKTPLRFLRSSISSCSGIVPGSVIFLGLCFMLCAARAGFDAFEFVLNTCGLIVRFCLTSTVNS